MICLYHLSKVTSRYFCHCTEKVVCKLSLLVVHILKRCCTVLTSFAVQLDFFCDDWSVSFTFAFISSNVVSPLVKILGDAIVVTISVMSSILSMSVNAFMLQIDNLNTYDQNFITFEVKKALRSAKKEKPRSLQFRFIHDCPIHTGVWLQWCTVHRAECRDTSGYFLSTSAVNLNSPPRKESETIENMAINRPLAPTFFTRSEKLIAWTICQHMDFVEEVSMNKFILKFVFCGFYNHYRNCFEYGSWSPGWKIRWTVRETSESAYGKVTSMSQEGLWKFSVPYEA